MSGTAAARLSPVEDPGLLLRGFYAIGRRMFGQVPTPEKLMAHRPALMLGLGGLYGAIEWCGSLDARLRALLQLQVARLHDVAY
jgi:hypothetical protein